MLSKEEAPREDEAPKNEVEMSILNQKEDARAFTNLLTAYDHMAEETEVEVG